MKSSSMSGRVLLRVAAALATLCVSLPAAAQPAPPRESAPERVDARPVAPALVTSDQDARETRTDLESLLKRLPPSVGQVMRIDPSLMRNPDYLATYPSLAAFLQSHPDVTQNPSYYLDHVSYELWNPRQPEDSKAEAVRMWRDLMQGLLIGLVFISGALALVWMVKTLLDYRRWYRTSRVQTEVHTKLLDRFSSNEDLMAYMQTPSGRRFLESAPLPLDGPARPVAAPLARILLSLQVGVVLSVTALGLLFVSGRVMDEVAQPLFALGVLVLALGTGFIVSTAASFMLSRRLGLLGPHGSSAEAASPGMTGV